MKEFTTPGVWETKKILVKMKVNKAAKYIGRAKIEAIKAKLEIKIANK